MAQFASRKARRKNVFGGGIKARHPAPIGPTLAADPESFIVDGPGFDRFKSAALLDRANRFSQGYGDIYQRLHGSLDVEDTNMPVRYRVGYPDQCFQTLWLHVLEGENWSFGQKLPQPGDVVLADDGAGVPVTIQDVEPAFTAESMTDQIVGPDTTPTIWAFAGETGLCAVNVQVPLRTITYSEQLSDAFPTVLPETSFPVTGQPTLQGQGLSIVGLAIQILLWGQCTAPDGINLGVGFGPSFQPGSFGQDWLAYIAACAGRYLWQMAMCETLAMLEDLENQSEGGQGGLVQGGSQMVAVQPTPANLAPPAVNNPVLQAVNQFVADNAVEIVLAVVELLL